jgi:hypothetical protein
MTRSDDSDRFDEEAYFDSLATKANGLLELIAALDAEVLQGVQAGAFMEAEKDMLRKLLAKLNSTKFELVGIRRWKDER